MTDNATNALAEAEALATKATDKKASDKAKAETADKAAAAKKAPTAKDAVKKAGEKAKAEKPKSAAQEEAEKAAAKAAAAKAEAEKLMKKVEAEAEKNKKAAEAERFRKVTETALEKDAKEINVRFEKAEQMAGKADDMRLAAAIMLADAKEKCREAKIPFQEWAEKNVKHSYENIRKLVLVGVAENKEAGAGKLALEDMRNRNAEANRKHRAEARANGLLIKIDAAIAEAGKDATGLSTLSKAKASLKTAMDDDKTTLEVLTDKNQSAGEAYTEFKKANGIGKRPPVTDEQKAAHAGANAEGAAPARKLSDLERVEQVVAGVAKDVRSNCVKAVAEGMGMRVLSEDEATKYKVMAKHAALSSRDQIEQLFARLTGKEQAAVAAWTAEQVGGTFTPKA